MNNFNKSREFPRKTNARDDYALNKASIDAEISAFYAAADPTRPRAEFRAAGESGSTKLTAVGEWLNDKWLDVQIWFAKTSLGQWIKMQINIATLKKQSRDPNYPKGHEIRYNPLFEGEKENRYNETLTSLPGKKFDDDIELSIVKIPPDRWPPRKERTEGMSSVSEENHTKCFSLFDCFRHKPSKTTAVKANEDIMKHAHYNPLFDPNPK